MAEWVSPEQIRIARKADLYDFLLRHHPNSVELEGDSLRLKDNHSVTLKRGYSGYKDWATDESGNAIEFLQRFLNYEFPAAVTALCTDAGVSSNPTVSPTASRRAPQPRPAGPMEPPAPLQGPYRQLYAYLNKSRGIPADMITRLIEQKLLYQDAQHGNAVFIDPARTFAELRGTNTFKPYHQVMFSDPAAFWWFKSSSDLHSNATVAYICEGSIDAISLYLLRKDQFPQENALYCSIGGVANQQRIDRIKQGMAAAHCQTIIAVDNDEAGELCRQRNSDCPSIIPNRKDWNEDLIAKIRE